MLRSNKCCMLSNCHEKKSGGPKLIVSSLCNNRQLKCIQGMKDDQEGCSFDNIRDPWSSGMILNSVSIGRYIIWMNIKTYICTLFQF